MRYKTYSEGELSQMSLNPVAPPGRYKYLVEKVTERIINGTDCVILRLRVKNKEFDGAADCMLFNNEGSANTIKEFCLSCKIAYGTELGEFSCLNKTGVVDIGMFETKKGATRNNFNFLHDGIMNSPTAQPASVVVGVVNPQPSPTATAIPAAFDDDIPF